MTPRSAAQGAPRPEATVGLVVEQLRRRVPGGIGTYSRGLISGLLELAPGERPPLALIASRAPAGADPLTALGPPLSLSRSSSRWLTEAWSVGVARLRGYRLVHSTSLDVPISEAPLVVTVHDLLWRELPEAYGRHGRAWHEAALRRAARRATAFVVPDASVREALLGSGLGIGASQVEVIEEGADHLPPADDAAASGALRALGVEGGFLLCVGTLEPRKNLPRLFAAYREARQACPGLVPLVVCGPEGWGQVVGDGAAGEGVLLAGRVPDATLAALYRRAPALVHVPLAEGFGLPVVEAMAAGTPVVASPIPANGGAALEVDPLEVPAIAKAILTVSSDAAARERLVAAGRRRAASLTWRACAAAHVSLWDSVAPRSPHDEHGPNER